MDGTIAPRKGRSKSKGKPQPAPDCIIIRVVCCRLYSPMRFSWRLYYPKRIRFAVGSTIPVSYLSRAGALRAARQVRDIILGSSVQVIDKTDE